MKCIKCLLLELIIPTKWILPPMIRCKLMAGFEIVWKIIVQCLLFFLSAHLFRSLNRSSILPDWILGSGISYHMGNFGEFCKWPLLKRLIMWWQWWGLVRVRWVHQLLRLHRRSGQGRHDTSPMLTLVHDGTGTGGLALVHVRTGTGGHHDKRI